MISSCQDYNFLAHLQEFSSGTNAFESVICQPNAKKNFNFDDNETLLEEKRESHVVNLLHPEVLLSD